MTARLTEAERALARDVAERADDRRGISEADRPWSSLSAATGDGVTSHDVAGVEGWPVLHLDDVSAIPFLDDISGVEMYQLRARVRARTGDLYTATCPEMPSYERYNRERLDLGAPEFVFAEPVGFPARIARAAREGEALGSIAAAARRAGGLYIHPYMGSEPVWELARAVADAAAVDVRVIAPPPAAVWFTNDKADVTWTAREVAGDGVLGGEPVVDTEIATTPAALARHLRTLAGRHARVALKMTRCASAMGNCVLDAEQVRASSDAELDTLVADFLTSKQWVDGDEVCVVSWEDATSSPSTQLWIPPLGAGDPVVQGVYEQILQGPRQVFWGSIPSRLGADMDARLARASLRVGAVYQALGYVGRCSFDFIVFDGRAAFVECNGRWGGTSTPMHLVERLFGPQRPPYRARDFVYDQLAEVSFADLAAAIGDELYDARTGQGRFILYNVGCMAGHGKLDVIALGSSVDAASRALEEDLPRILGL